MIDDALLLLNAEAYAKSRHIRVFRKERLGHGSDGSVWRTSRPSAVKAVARREAYEKELECYRRLKSAGVQNVGGFDVPVLEGFDDDLLVIEMSIVQPPYLLDFGKVYLDRPPTEIYDAQMMRDAHAEWRERFGSRWNEVASVLRLLTKYGIYYIDPRPSNIDAGDDEGDVDFRWDDYEPEEEP